MLAKIEGFAAAVLGRLDHESLATLVSDLDAIQATVQAQRELSAVLTDTSIANVSRGQVVGELLANKVSPAAKRLCVYAVASAPAQEVPHVLDELAHAARTLLATGDFHHPNRALLDARRRVNGFADAVLDEIDTDNFFSIEDDLFRWARMVEANEELRHLLLDRDAPLESRLGVTDQLLAGKVSPIALDLARFVVVGGRPRDVVGTLDYLVDYVAQTRDWRVARVHSARALDETSERELITTLAALTGRSVDLQVADEPDLLSGVLVEIGDLRLDATTRGRLSALHETLTAGRASGFASN